MPEIEKSGSVPAGLKAGDGSRPRWLWLSQSVSAKLLLLLIGSLLAIFGALGFVNIRLHRQHLEASTLQAAERQSDVIKRSTSH